MDERRNLKMEKNVANIERKKDKEQKMYAHHNDKVIPLTYILNESMPIGVINTMFSHRRDTF
jgi:hypothetical protein